MQLQIYCKPNIVPTVTFGHKVLRRLVERHVGELGTRLAIKGSPLGFGDATISKNYELKSKNIIFINGRSNPRNRVQGLNLKVAPGFFFLSINHLLLVGDPADDWT